jgi:hypothetical protein
VTSLERALRFSLAAWRDSWLVLSLSVVGPAVMFFGEHGPVSRDLGMALIAGGGLWSMIIFAPLTAGLYRSALNRYGGPQGRTYPHGLAGLRLGAGEARMLGLAILMFLLAVLFLAPAALIAAVVSFVLRSQGDLSVLAALRYGAYCGLGVLALYPFVALRVALGGVATVAEDDIRLFQTWPMTQKRLLSVALPLLGIMLLYPLALGVTALVNLNEIGEMSLAVGRWPVVDATAGAALSGLFHGALMPALFAGTLSHLYLKWRPGVPAVARRKPILRVVADLVETGHEPAEEGVPAVAANDYGEDGAVAARTRWNVAAYQIGADRIDWPDHRSVAFDTSGQTFGEPGPAPPTPTPEGVWPELEVMAQRFSRSFEPVSSVTGSAAHHPVYDGEGHEPARSPIDPSMATLEHPMLLAPDAPWSSPVPASGAYEWATATGPVRLDPEADPARVEVNSASGSSLTPGATPSDSGVAQIPPDSGDSDALAELFWLSGVVPPEVMATADVDAAPLVLGLSDDRNANAGLTDAPASHVEEPRNLVTPVLPLQPEPQMAANAEDAAELTDPLHVMAIAPSAQDVPPPVEVIAYLPPRPFHPAAADLDAAVAANDAAPPPEPTATLVPALSSVRDAIVTAEGHEG